MRDIQSHTYGHQNQLPCSLVLHLWARRRAVVVVQQVIGLAVDMGVAVAASLPMVGTCGAIQEWTSVL